MGTIAFMSTPIDRTINYNLKKVHEYRSTHSINILKKILQILFGIFTKEATSRCPMIMMYLWIYDLAMGFLLRVLLANFS